MIGIPSNVTQDAPVTALWNSWYGALFLQDDWRIGSAGDAQPRPAVGRPDARHRSAEPVHDLRAGPEVHRQRGGARRAAVLRRPRHRTRRHPDQLEPFLPARRHRLGSVRRREDGDPRRGGHVLRQHLGQRVEHLDQLPAVVYTPDVRQYQHQDDVDGRAAGRRRSATPTTTTPGARRSRTRAPTPSAGACSGFHRTSCGRIPTRPTSASSVRSGPSSRPARLTSGPSTGTCRSAAT